MRHPLLQSRSGHGATPRRRIRAVLTSIPRPNALIGWAHQRKSFLPNLVLYEDMSHALSSSATRCHTPMSSATRCYQQIILTWHHFTMAISLSLNSNANLKWIFVEHLYEVLSLIKWLDNAKWANHVFAGICFSQRYIERPLHVSLWYIKAKKWNANALYKVRLSLYAMHLIWRHCDTYAYRIKDKIKNSPWVWLTSVQIYFRMSDSYRSIW